MATILKFGRHKGSESSEVFIEDPNYCKWLYSQELILENDPAAKHYLKSTINGDDLTYEMTWGKYKGKTIRWIKNHDYG